MEKQITQSDWRLMELGRREEERGEGMREPAGRLHVPPGESWPRPGHGLSCGDDARVQVWMALGGTVPPMMWGRKIPWRKRWLPTPESLPRKFHGQRSLAGYCPWDHRVGHNWVTKTFTCGICFSDQGSNSRPPHWQHRVLTTKLSGKSRSFQTFLFGKVPRCPGSHWWASSRKTDERTMNRVPQCFWGLNCGFSDLPPWPLLGFAERQWWFQSHQSQLYAKQFIGSKGLIPSTKRSGLCPWILGSDL